MTASTRRFARGANRAYDRRFSNTPISSADVLGAIFPRSSQDTILIVGNGLSISLRSAFSDNLSGWDTSSPLSWTVPNLSAGDGSLLTALPAFNQLLAHYRTEKPEQSDFEAFRDVMTSIAMRTARHQGADSERDLHVRADVEMRHYLAIAFSYYQMAVWQLDISKWEWARVLSQVGPRLRGLVSFNYDLVAEHALHVVGHPARPLGVGTIRPGKFGGFKPHGSISYDIDPELFRAFRPDRYPPATYMFRSSYPQKEVPHKSLLRVRHSATIVVPGEANIYGDLPWSLHGWRWLRAIADGTERCVLAGLSYWEVDRPEIDRTLDMLPRSCRITVVNPYPPASLLQSLADRFENVRVLDRPDADTVLRG